MSRLSGVLQIDNPYDRTQSEIKLRARTHGPKNRRCIMYARRLYIGAAVVALALTACVISLPPAAVVTDLGAVVGTYSGSLKEYGKTPRPANLTVRPDGSFELTTGGPDGFRTTGFIGLASDADVHLVVFDQALVECDVGAAHDGDNMGIDALGKAGIA